MNRAEKIFLASMIIVAIAFAAFVIFKLNTKSNFCTDLGGTLVKTIDGWACVRLEKLT